jgi:hypothetical protein
MSVRHQIATARLPRRHGESHLDGVPQRASEPKSETEVLERAFAATATRKAGETLAPHPTASAACQQRGLIPRLRHSAMQRPNADRGTNSVAHLAILARQLVDASEMRDETGFGEAEHLRDSPGLPFCKCLGLHQRRNLPKSLKLTAIGLGLLLASNRHNEPLVHPTSHPTGRPMLYNVTGSCLISSSLDFHATEFT